MKVLFCTDGSKISFNALHNFAKWSKNAIVDAICVIDWSFLPDDISIEAEGFSINCANIADSILEYTKKEKICIRFFLFSYYYSLFSSFSSIQFMIRRSRC